jgi:probable HAF family extracellular repeat protein
MAGDGVVITQPGGTTPQYLGNLGGPAYATGINNKGQVVGYSATTNQSNAAVYGVLYSQGKIVNLGLPKGETAPQYESFATAINDHGQIVGYSSGGSPLVPSHGLLYLNNHWHDLNDLVNATVNGLTIVEANGINDLGQIVATATDAAGNEHAVILTVVGSKPAFVP